MALSFLAVLGLFGVAGLAVLFGLNDVVQGRQTSAESIFLIAGALAFSGLLVLPSGIYAALRIAGIRPMRDLRLPGCLRPTLLILALPLVLLLGYLLVTRTDFAWLGLPPLQVLAVGLPILWIGYLAVHGLPLGSPQRSWGVLASGLVLGPALILIMEGVALVGVVVLISLWLGQQPELQEQILQLMQYTGDPQEMQQQILDLLEPYLATPAALFGALSFTAVIVPLLEEMLKPIGVWLLAGRGISPAAGFAGGALSGAGYALFESMALTSSGEEWLYVVVARAGTGAVHIFTTALMGWALARAWRYRTYLNFGLAYLAAVLIHGLWNALTVFVSFASFPQVQSGEAGMDFVSRLGAVAPFGLAFLALGTLVLVLLSNRLIRRGAAQPEGSQ